MINDQNSNFLVKQANEIDEAKLFQNSTQRPYHFQTITQALDTAQDVLNPIKVGFPFKSVTVRTMTDSATSIKMQVGGRDDMNPAIVLKQNDALNFDFPVNEAYLSWPAQPGKSVTLLFAIDSVLSIGVNTTAISGGVNIQDGTAVAAIASVTLAAATAAAIAPALATRKACILVNNTGATIYLGGDNTVTADTAATGGIPIVAGGTFRWNNTAALYAISTPGGKVNRLEES